MKEDTAIVFSKNKNMIKRGSPVVTNVAGFL